MRVLLTHKFYNHTGGAEVFFHEVGRVLKENGHEVAYYSTNNDDRYEDDGNTVFWAEDVNYNSGNLIQKVNSFSKVIYNKTNKETFREAIRQFKPDIVHAFAIYVTITPSILDVCKEMNVPVVMSCNDYKIICPNYKLYHHGNICEACKGGNFYNAVKNKCCKNSLMFSMASMVEAYDHDRRDVYKKNIDYFLFASEFMANKTAEFWGKDSFKWKMLRNPFDSTQFEMQEESEDYILFFGRLIDEKGVDILVKAMKTLPNIKVKIVGDGTHKADYEKLADGAPNIEFTGPKWNKELDPYLTKSRFVIVPSIWHENFPYVILQSFAYGKPVIGTNRGGIPEMVEDGKRGLIYNATDPQDLAQKIDYLWNKPELTAQFGRNAKEWADAEFNDNKFYDNIISIYKATLN